MKVMIGVEIVKGIPHNPKEITSKKSLSIHSVGKGLN